MTDRLYINESKEVFDVLIVGSGITGSWPLKSFANADSKPWWLSVVVWWNIESTTLAKASLLGNSHSGSE